jgi:peptide/nickel transport system ATP-binding protein
MHCELISIYESACSEMIDEVIKISNLCVEARSQTEKIRAVNNASLSIYKGEVVGLIGESGSGKTTLIRSILDLHERNVEIVQGEVFFKNELFLDKSKNVNKLSSLRGKHVGMVFQSPRASLNPLMTIGALLDEVIWMHDRGNPKASRKLLAIEILNDMGLDGARVYRSYPHQLSGGMCQRAAIALAIATKPDLIIADECTSALDVTTQAEVISTLRKLKNDYSTTLIFVTHDILLASEICDRLIVMQSGNVVEIGETKELLRNPQNLYTKALIASVPRWK